MENVMHVEKPLIDDKGNIVIDKLGKPLSMGDHVIYTHYDGIGTLCAGKIVRTTKKFVLIGYAPRIDDTNTFDFENVHTHYLRQIRKHQTRLYLVKID